MRTYQVGELMTDEDSLAHYGIRGMKWGVRKVKEYRNTPDSSGVSRKQARQQIKRQNLETRRHIEDFERASNRSDLIRTSRRNRVAMQRYYEDVKADVRNKRGSGELGRNAARVVMNKARNERYTNIHKAESRTAGEQFVEALFAPREPRTAAA